MIKLTQVSKNYGQHTVVDQVSFSVSPEQSVAIIGHNGAGKTTLMKLILGLVRPSEGALEISTDPGRDPHADIGFLPETVSFPGEMTGNQVLRYYAKLKKVSLNQCSELLELVGLSTAATSRVKTYSKGMRQRLGLAQALLGNPKLLLLDEPTTGLDPFLRRHFYGILRECKTKGTAILISSHALSEIEGEIDKILIMRKGSVIIQGTLEQLREAAQLPTQIHVEVLAGEESRFAAFQQTDHLNGENRSSSITFLCQQSEKVELMGQIMTHQKAIKNLQIIPPGLDDLYSHFVEQADQP